MVEATLLIQFCPKFEEVYIFVDAISDGIVINFNS
jgi:hypothetical protein